MIRVPLPRHLRTLGQVDDERCLEVPPPVALRAALDALKPFPTTSGGAPTGCA